jgi:hypothetical protein
MRAECNGRRTPSEPVPVTSECMPAENPSAPVPALPVVERYRILRDQLTAKASSLSSTQLLPWCAHRTLRPMATVTGAASATSFSKAHAPSPRKRLFT